MKRQNLGCSNRSLRPFVKLPGVFVEQGVILDEYKQMVCPARLPSEIEAFPSKCVIKSSSAPSKDSYLTRGTTILLYLNNPRSDRVDKQQGN